MQALFGVPPTVSPTIGGGVGHKQSMLDWPRCERCGFSYPGPTCNNAPCNRSEIEANYPDELAAEADEEEIESDAGPFTEAEATEMRARAIAELSERVDRLCRLRALEARL